MEELKRTVQEEMFEIEVQYCDPDDCLGYRECPVCNFNDSSLVSMLCQKEWNQSGFD